MQPLPRRKQLSEADLEVLVEKANRPEHRTAPHYRAGSLPPSPASQRGERKQGWGQWLQRSLFFEESAPWRDGLVSTHSTASPGKTQQIRRRGPRHFPPFKRPEPQAAHPEKGHSVPQALGKEAGHPGRPSRPNAARRPLPGEALGGSPRNAFPGAQAGSCAAGFSVGRKCLPLEATISGGSAG